MLETKKYWGNLNFLTFLAILDKFEQSLIISNEFPVVASDFIITRVHCNTECFFQITRQLLPLCMVVAWQSKCCMTWMNVKASWKVYLYNLQWRILFILPTFARYRQILFWFYSDSIHNRSFQVLVSLLFM